MTSCPKCGSAFINGPRYVPSCGDTFGRERLRYQCGRCGFQSDEPTRDTPAKAASPRSPEEPQ